MRILYIHNDYAKPSGEETAAEAIVALLKEHGHEVAWHRRSSAEIAGSVSGQVKSLFTGVWNPCEAKAVAEHIKEFKPDIVQVQNIYPLLSPSIFPAIRKLGIPIVMRCPNYRLFCPNGLCCDMQGHVCEQCFGGHEWRCAFKNCTGSRLKSFGYALRGWASRVTQRILDNVDVFIVQTEFQRQKFMKQGIPERKLGILPGIMPLIEPPSMWQIGKYITFVGRVSAEKGIDDFLGAARLLPDLPFRVAGNYEGMPGIREASPPNIEWMGFLKGEALRQAYLDSRIIVIPSKWYEGFPNVIVMGMMLEKPIITAAIGATGTIIDDGHTGLLFAPGDTVELADKISALYQDVNKCREYGINGANVAKTLYSRESIYDKLMSIYRQAIDN